jgi:hypothetical protein
MHDRRRPQNIFTNRGALERVTTETNQDIVITKDQVITTLSEALAPEWRYINYDFVSEEGWTQ